MTVRTCRKGGRREGRKGKKEGGEREKGGREGNQSDRMTHHLCQSVFHLITAKLWITEEGRWGNGGGVSDGRVGLHSDKV